jgi:hypothetical protein
MVKSGTKRRWRCWVGSLLSAALLCGAMSGCSEPPEPTPEEQEKIQQDHRDRAEREMQDG